MTQALAIVDPLAFGQENNTMHFANGWGIIRFTEIQHVSKEDRNRYTLLNENREVFFHIHLKFANVLRLKSFLFSPIFNLVGAITPSSEYDAYMFPEHLFIFACEVLLVFFQVLSCRLLVSIGGVDEDYEEMGILYILSEFFHHFYYVFLVGIYALVQTWRVHHSQLYLLLKVERQDLLLHCLGASSKARTHFEVTIFTLRAFRDPIRKSTLSISCVSDQNEGKRLVELLVLLGREIAVRVSPLSWAVLFNIKEIARIL